MPGTAVGRVAAGLPWLCPNTDGLIRLAEAPAALARPSAADDVALVLFLLRFAPSAGGLFDPAALAGGALPDAAAAHLRAVPGAWLDPACEVAVRCRTFARAAGGLARALADHTGRACPERAAALACILPLGWLAVAAVNADAAGGALATPPARQQETWGLDQNAVARRLAHRWRLPDWAATALGATHLPLAAARAIVPDAGLFAVVQLAALEAERRDPSLGLTGGASRAELLAELGLDDAAVNVLRSPEAPVADAPSGSDPNPHRVPLVVNLLKMAADARRRNGVAVVLRLEDRLDQLHGALARADGDVAGRTRDGRLAALAELAAGAGHEINNPLAVISGHAQRLLRTEPDPDRGAALQSVVRQTHRIAGIVRDLMQFARPPRPAAQRLSVTEILTAVAAELCSFAAERGVQIEVGHIPADAYARSDRAQLQHALAAVARNGIEAAGAGGWVRIDCTAGDEAIRFVIEDSGPGLTTESLAHAFDPFYCGRPAGRGRGLGLPTAWQFLRQNGGDVRHEPTDGPTRFVVTVPRSVALDFPDRQSA